MLTSNQQQLQEMMADLNSASEIVGLKMNLNKTKIMCNQYTQERPITMENHNIEQVHEYNYLGQL